jgi:hypothetical protein
MKTNRRESLANRLATAAVLLVMFAAMASAHEGPPYPIVVDQPAGPVVVSVWADPDVGTGTFFVMLDPPPGGTVPDDVAVEIAVQPITGRLEEARHGARRQEEIRNRVQFAAEVPFDREERWRVRVLVASGAGAGEAATEVEVTPPGLGQWDLLLYLFPFAAVALLWARAVLARRKAG